MVQLKSSDRLPKIVTAAAELASETAKLQRIRTTIAQMDEVRTCLNSLRYADKPLPVKAGDEAFDYVNTLLAAQMMGCEKRIREITNAKENN